MKEERLSALATLRIKAELVRQLHFNDILSSTFSHKKV